MKKKRNHFQINIILMISIALIIISWSNDANAFFHDQASKDKGILDAQEFIINIFDNVNVISNNYQNELYKESLTGSNNNMTIVNKTNEYIDSLEKIITLAKEYNIHKDYKSILIKYINSLQNEIDSYIHYKNYILTGNYTENKLSLDLLSKALIDETQAIKEFKQLQ